jgi:hypothetical protein
VGASTADAVADALRLAFFISAGVIAVGLLIVLAGVAVLLLRSFGVGYSLETAEAQKVGVWDLLKQVLSKSLTIAFDEAKQPVTRTIAIGMVVLTLGLVPTVGFGIAWATAAGLEAADDEDSPTDTTPTTTGRR